MNLWFTTSEAKLANTITKLNLTNSRRNTQQFFKQSRDNELRFVFLINTFISLLSTAWGHESVEPFFTLPFLFEDEPSLLERLEEEEFEFEGFFCSNEAPVFSFLELPVIANCEENVRLSNSHIHLLSTTSTKNQWFRTDTH